MPIGELEHHPYLVDGEIPGSARLILGSFPVYECSDPDNPIKFERRRAEGTARFFYGSVDSKFWWTYGRYQDNRIAIPANPDTILEIFRQQNIAISDLITHCQRRGYSSNDSDLRQKAWNKEGISILINDRVRKILCTSKGVLKCLEKQVLVSLRNPIAVVDNNASEVFQSKFIDQIGGDANTIIGPIARAFRINGNELVYALAIPSPGSPQRQIKRFGRPEEVMWWTYNDLYLRAAFAWFIE